MAWEMSSVKQLDDVQVQLSAGLEEISITDYPAVIASRASQLGTSHVVLGGKWIAVLHILTTVFFSLVLSLSIYCIIYIYTHITDIIYIYTYHVITIYNVIYII